MVPGETGELPQRGTLLRRAYELLETLGQPTAEETLIQHLFGADGSKNLWTVLLRQTLRSSPLFAESSEAGFAGEVRWSLTAWQSTQRSLSDVDFVVIDTETTGMRPGPDRVIEIGAVRIHNGVIADTF